MDVTKIEEKLDKVAAGAITVSDDVGGIKFTDMMQVMEFAKMLSISGFAVRKHLRGEPGACLGVVIQALEWRFSPYFCANKCFVVNDQLGWEAQLLHAVILTRAPIMNQEAHVEYIGEGNDRQARVWVTLKSGGIKDYTTPKIGAINPKNSPLWKNDPDQQLFYFAARSLARRHFPHVLGGVYSKDELEDSEEFTGPDKAKDVTPPKPSLSSRLKGTQARGFDAKHVEKETTSMKESAGLGASAADGKAGEAVEQSTAASPANPIMEVSDAFDLGRQLKSAGKPLEVPPEIAGVLFAAHRDALAAGYAG